MQRFFNLDIDALGRGVSAWQLGACAACVPRGSALLAGIDKSSEYTVTDTYLHAITCILAHKWVSFPWENKHEGNALPPLGSMSVEEFEEWLKRDWKEDEGGFSV